MCQYKVRNHKRNNKNNNNKNDNDNTDSSAMRIICLNIEEKKPNINKTSSETWQYVPCRTVPVKKI